MLVLPNDALADAIRGLFVDTMRGCVLAGLLLMTAWLAAAGFCRRKR